MDVTRALNSDDLRRMARRRLPRIVFDYIEGGVEDEEGLERNRRACFSTADSCRATWPM